MRKILLASFFVLASSFALFAQKSSDDKLDVFGGYSFVHVSPGQGANSINQNGWESMATFKLTPVFGLAADVDGTYKTQSGAKNSIYTYLFGPQFKFGDNKGALLVHGLMGFAHDNVSTDIGGTTLSASDNAFAMAFGGGYDWRASQAMSIRLCQFDYLVTRFGSQTQNNIRLSFGVTFHPKFGRGL
ncbi:MAG TPA: outer membrane beta-barrel protein [Terriglobales bacterium]|nr:outer membrane beta-barrel protein [Terriglobales bacterium]